MSNKTIEILAPAGSIDSLVAAVRCGANAVYLGAGDFNARRHADNFTQQELKHAVEYCHVHGVKVYLTLNTLVSDAEINNALELISSVCAIGVDAFIVQDLGIASLCREVAPSVPLHASTQISVMSTNGFKKLESLGFTRAVLPRELSFEEIKEIRENTTLELEMFVHGALCMCVSGQCYLSSMLGGRSGNRGLCAQPCRLPFEAPGGSRFDLSLKDLSLIEYLPKLSDLGIESFKIEGRMKRPEYVAAAVTACRERLKREELKSTLKNGDIDYSKIPTTRERDINDKLRAIFSRSGFTDGYLTSHLSRSMFGIRQKEDVTSAAPVLKELSRLYQSEVQDVPVSISLTAELGKPLMASASTGKTQVFVTSSYKVQKAQNHATEISKIREQLKKSGGTPFDVKMTDIKVDEDVNIPLSEINSIRRLVLDELERRLASGYKKHTIFDETKIPLEDYATTSLLDLGAHSIIWKKAPTNKTNISSASYNLNKRPNCIARFADVSQIPEDFSRYTSNLNNNFSDRRDNDFKITSIIVPLHTTEDKYSIIKKLNIPFGVELPRALWGDNREVKKLLTVAKENGASFAYCGTLDGVVLAQNSGFTVMGGATLNAYNSFALAQLKGLGLHSVVVSTELELNRINQLRSPLPRGVIAYGRTALMLTRNCPIRNGRNCKSCGSNLYLTDRKGIRFPVTCKANAGLASEILNSRPINLSDKQEELKNIDFSLLYFTVESQEKVSKIIKDFEISNTPQGEFTRGLYYRGVE